MYSDVHPSLHLNCHHQIVLDKFNLAILYLPLYKRLVWHSLQANTNLIKQAIELFDWKKGTFNLDVIKQVPVFNEMIMNIFENFIPHKAITCNDKDRPWIKNTYKQIKTLIAGKNDL